MVARRRYRALISCLLLLSGLSCLSMAACTGSETFDDTGAWSDASDFVPRDTGLTSSGNTGADTGVASPEDTGVDTAEVCVKQGVEQCNGIDDDCNGVVDQGCQCDYKGKSDGVCGESAYIHPESGECSKPPRYEEEESSCDQRDNDCDGEVDEGQCSCNYNDTAVGVCKAAETDPEDGTCLKPEAYQADESLCDGKDNDCDGQTDEDCTCVHGTTEKCYTGPSDKAGVGICDRGERTCEKGEWSECTGAVEPKPEACDGVDNNCNGEVDEGVEITEDFEGGAAGWKKHTSAKDWFQVDAQHTGSVHGGQTAGRAWASCHGTCGWGGLAKKFSLATNPGKVSMWLRAKTDPWGRVNVMLKDSSGYHMLWEKKGSGSSVRMGWTQKTFDISKFDKSFTLIVGNADQSKHCRRACDHQWSIWVDDVTMKKGCSSQP